MERNEGLASNSPNSRNKNSKFGEKGRAAFEGKDLIKEMNIICRHDIFPFLRDYLLSVRCVLPTKIIIVETYEKTNIVQKCTKNPIVVFVQSPPPKHVLVHLKLSGKHVFVLNTEQASRIGNNMPECMKQVLNVLQKHVGYIDYSKANMDRVLKNAHPQKTYLLPYFVNPREIYVRKRHQYRKSVAFLGEMTPRRKAVIDTLRARSIRVVVVSGWNQGRDFKLFGCSHLLNVHAHDNYTVFEEIRCSRCVFNQMTVISEDSEIDPHHPIRQFITFSPYNQLVDTVCAAMKNSKCIHADVTKLKKQLIDYAIIPNLKQ